MDNNLDRNKRGIKKSQLFVFYPNNNHSNNFERVILMDESWVEGCFHTVLPALVPAYSHTGSLSPPPPPGA